MIANLNEEQKIAVSNFWVRMTEKYSTKWTNREGVSPTDDSQWIDLFFEFTLLQIAGALELLKTEYVNFAPTFIEFEALCRSPRALGLPEFNVAFGQALSGRIAHPAVRVASREITFDLKKGKAEDTWLRDRFYSYYSIVVKRKAKGEPIDKPFDKRLCNEKDKETWEEKLKRASKCLEDRMENTVQQRINAQGVSKDPTEARLQCLAVLGIKPRENS